MNTKEGQPPWWVGRASNPVGGAKRRWVGSTPMPFRHSCIGLHWPRHEPRHPAP